MTNFRSKSCKRAASVHPRTGYGRCYVQGKRVRAHRAAWVEAYGPIPEGMWVLHRCDNRACIEPTHLFLGTAQDNTDDMVSKGRLVTHDYAGPRGTRHPGAKLTDDKVRAIRRLYASGEWSQKGIGEMFGVSAMLVNGIVNGKRWRHVE